MAHAKVIRVTRDSVTLTWDMAKGACAYSIVRVGPIVDGDDKPESNILAAVYATTFCDTDLVADSRYRYQLTLVPDPAASSAPRPDVETVDAQTLTENQYASSRAFFTEALSVWYCRNTNAGGTVRWCPQWWLHAEAAARVDALWMAWEQCHRDEGAAPAAWWVNYSDPIMRELFEQQGGFAGCGPERGHKPAHGPLPESAATP